MDLRRINEFIDNKYEEGLKLLEQLVNIDSPSRNKKCVDEVGKVICDYFDQYGIDHQIVPNENYGDFIIATIKKDKPGKILLLGHRDTVFPIGTAKQRPFKIEGGRAYGPGVSDMKSGIVSSILASLTLKELGVEMSDIEILITPDEEIGSPSSRKMIEERAKDAIAVFNLEPGRPDGSVVTARRGSAHLTFHIQGRAAHAGVNIEQGISAIEELGHKIISLQELTDFDKGITVNVGVVEGGVNTNVVAPEASGKIHIGFWTIDDFNYVYNKIKTIFETSYVQGTKSELKGGISFLPMEKNDGVQKLYRIVQRAASGLDLIISEQHTNGASDAGFPSSLGIPTICGMGPVGGNWHSENEYMEVNTFLPRIKLLAHSMVLASRQL